MGREEGEADIKERKWGGSKDAVWFWWVSDDILHFFLAAIGLICLCSASFCLIKLRIDTRGQNKLLLLFFSSAVSHLLARCTTPLRLWCHPWSWSRRRSYDRGVGEGLTWPGYRWSRPSPGTWTSHRRDWRCTRGWSLRGRREQASAGCLDSGSDKVLP